MTVAPMAVAQWRRSPVFTTAPDPALAPADGDNNSWAFVRSGVATPADDTTGWRIYRARVTPRRRVAQAGGRVAFDGVAGRATLWIDGRTVATKADPATARLSAPLPAGTGPRTFALVVEAPVGMPSGIVAPVSILPLP